MNAAKNPYRKLIYNDSLDTYLHIEPFQYRQTLTLWWVTSSVSFISGGFLAVLGYNFGHIFSFSDAF
jgi:hypothetical protein